MRQLYTYLTESMQELYHFTNAGNLLNILKSDEMVASEDDGLNPSKFPWYISLTRTGDDHIGYPAGMIGKDIVRIVFDGKKLNTKYKVKPVNWYKGAKNNAIKANHDEDDWNDHYEAWMNQNSVEAEDRIFLKQPSIKNISKYIKRIYLNTETIKPQVADDIIRLADKMGIDLQVSASSKEFRFAR